MTVSNLFVALTWARDRTIVRAGEIVGISESSAGTLVYTKSMGRLVVSETPWTVLNLMGFDEASEEGWSGLFEEQADG